MAKTTKQWVDPMGSTISYQQRKVSSFTIAGATELADLTRNQNHDVTMELKRDDTKVDRVVLKNLVVNGDFSQGFANWVKVSNPNTMAVDDGQLVFDGTASLSGGYYQDISGNSTDKFYLRINYINITNPSPIILISNFGGYYNSHSPSQEGSEIFSKLGGVRLYLQQLRDVTYDRYALDDFIVINLTQTFGAGNEPSKEAMDRLIEQTGYFDEHTLDENWQVGEMARLDGAKANKQQEDWITPTLLNGWVQTNAINNPVRFYKNQMGEVILDGLISDGEGAFFVLPIGYRPSKTQFILAYSQLGYERFTITIDGGVNPVGKPTSYISLSNIKFRAEG